MTPDTSTSRTGSLTVALDPTTVAWIDANQSVRELLLAAGKSAAISSATVVVDAALLSQVLGRPTAPNDLSNAQAIVQGYTDQLLTAARGLHKLAAGLDSLRRLAGEDVQLVPRARRPARAARRVTAPARAAG